MITVRTTSTGYTTFTDEAAELITRVYGPSCAAFCMVNAYRPTTPKQLARIRAYFASSHRAQGARNIRRAVSSRANTTLPKEA